MISNIGHSIKKINENKRNVALNQGEQLTNILNYICELAKKEKVLTKNLWLDAIPENIYIDDLRKKYKIDNNKDTIIGIIGEYDDPFNQKQDLLKINLLHKENMLIFGNAESGKETLLSTFVYDLMTNYTSTQIQFYILDFGSETLKIFKNSNHVGDVIFLGNDEKIDRFFEMLQKEIKIRKNKLSNYTGGYDEYITKKNDMPIFMIILNNYEVFEENYSIKYDELFLTLTRESVNCGILFTVTASVGGSVKYRLSQNFNRKIALQLNSDDDYHLIFDNIKNKRPSRIFGRGLTSVNNEIYEFQTAKICSSKEYNIFIERTITQLNDKNKVKAKQIKTLPNVLKISDVKEFLKDISNIPIGMRKKDLSIYTYDFVKNFMTIICANDTKKSVIFIENIFKLIEGIKNIKIKTVNLDSIMQNSNQDLNRFVKEFYLETEEFIQSTSDDFTFYTIIGIENFLSIEGFGEQEFNQLLVKSKKSKKCSFIIIENVNKLKEYIFSDWFKENIKVNTGIWIGKGIEDQTVMIPEYNNEEIKNNCLDSYGYILENSEALQIKLLGVKDEEENDE